MLGSHGAQYQDAQEKPDFPAHPNEGADDSDVPELSLKLPADMTLVTFSLLHLLH